jgi:hypothetical protein
MVVMVVVVNPTQIRQFQVTRQRGSLAVDALHQASVTRQRVHVVVK